MGKRGANSAVSRWRKRPELPSAAVSGTGDPPGDLPLAEADSGMESTGRSRRGTRTKGTKIAETLGLLSLSVAVTVGFFEALLAAFPGLQVQANEGEYIFCSPSTRHVEHPRFGHTETPGASYFERNSPRDPWYYVHINEEGFRDNQRHSGERVIVLGDSMTRGTLVNEYESYGSLINQWHPDMGFHIYGVGGYGQANTLRVYQDKGAEIPHRLVIQQITLPNDLDDNVERTRRVGDGFEVDFAKVTAKTTEGTLLLLRVHQFLWQASSLYRIVYDATLRASVQNWDARRDIDNALDLTRRLLVGLAAEAAANQADLLFLVIPGWPEIVGRDDGMAPERQREMLRAFVEDVPNAHFLDATPGLARADPDLTFGVIDKHLTAYGHFLVAEALDQWLLQDWQGKSSDVRPRRTFVQQPAIVPDCALTEDYLDWVRPI